MDVFLIVPVAVGACVVIVLCATVADMVLRRWQWYRRWRGGYWWYGASGNWWREAPSHPPEDYR